MKKNLLFHLWRSCDTWCRAKYGHPPNYTQGKGEVGDGASAEKREGGLPSKEGTAEELVHPQKRVVALPQLVVDRWVLSHLRKLHLMGR